MEDVFSNTDSLKPNLDPVDSLHPNLDPASFQHINLVLVEGILGELKVEVWIRNILIPNHLKFSDIRYYILVTMKMKRYNKGNFRLKS